MATMPQGAWLLLLRLHELWLSLQTAAQRLEVEPSTVSRWLPHVRDGRILIVPSRLPHGEHREAIARVFGVPVSSWHEFVEIDPAKHINEQRAAECLPLTWCKFAPEETICA